MFRALLKKQFYELASSMVVGKKGKNGKSHASGKGGIIAFVLVFGLVALSLFAAFMGLSEMFGNALLPQSPASYFSLISAMGLLIGIIIGLLTAMSSLFKAKDNDLLLSLPIPTGYILIARMLVVFISTTLFSLVSVIPMLINYQLKVGGLAAKNIVFAVILTLGMGLLASTFAVLLSWLLELIASRFKNKNAAITAFWIIFFLAYYYFYMKLQNYLQVLVDNIEKVEHVFKTYLYPIDQFGQAMTGNALSLLIFMGISIALFAIVCFILSRTFLKLASATQITKIKNAKKEIIKAGTIGSTLLRKELKRFTGSPVYMINAGLGLILSVIFIFVTFAKKGDLETFFLQLPIELNIYVLFVVASMVFSMLSMMSACSVSMEGNSIWILRSLPIEAYPVLKAKRNLQIILTVVPNALLLIVSAVLFKVNPLNLLLALVILLLANFFVSDFGLFLNLKKPNLTWINEAVPVKQSMPVFISLFGGMIIGSALSAGFVYLNVILKGGLIPYLSLVIVFGILSALLENWIKHKGCEIWNRL